jgi:large subunit ribosomal protein L6
MSRIGKMPIKIPEGVVVTAGGGTVTVQGTKGSLSQEIRPEIGVSVEDGSVVVSVKKPSKNSPAFWGLTRALINNMVIGVTEGFEKRLELVGVGYRAKQEGQNVSFSVGYSHPVVFEPADGVEIKVVDQTHLTVSGTDRQQVGLAAAKMREIRKPEPYKGKGIRYEGEVVRRKAGKAGKAVA